ncbi:regulator of protease activity HflC (stomatin/prohibitin superfamily) [Streptacidiphilus sp. BW17]|uniref:SPFH domain-containing protein n=1 Tax=Streptacidiphilus sp. BW17 TaxID=3156274 RepID=UPI00351996AE
MADITRRPLFSHFRGSPTDHVVHLRRGQVVHQGTGQAFWFRPISAVLAEVPVDDRELPLLFHARTADFQDVTVQASVTYRFTDPELATRRLDFAIDPGTGRWRSAPLEQVATLLTELAQQQAIGLVATLDLTTALATGTAAVQARISEGLTADARLTDTGVGVVGVRVVAVKPEAEVERALRTPAREQIAQEADRAGFERRALAVERERAISENELQSRIELARREEQLVGQQGANERRRAEQKAEAARITTDAEAARITTDAEAARTRTLAAAQAEQIELVGAAEAQAEAAKLANYAGLDPRLLLALAAKELAGGLPAIGTLNLTPDVVTGALARLAAPNGG